MAKRMKKKKIKFGKSLMFPSRFVSAEDLQGRDHDVTIESIKREQQQMEDGDGEAFWVLTFAGRKKPFILKPLNANTIAGLHGTVANDWVGKRITLYPTTCRAFGETCECIRIRDRIPGASKPDSVGFANEPDDEHGDAPEVQHHCPDCKREAWAAPGSKPECNCGATMLEGVAN